VSGGGLGPEQARSLEECLAAGGVALFPADTVYGLAADPEAEQAVARLYALKGRAPDKPAAVMFFDLEPAMAIAANGPRLERALRALLPGPVTVLVPNARRRFPLAGAGDLDTLGLRVPLLPDRLHALTGVRQALLQSSANRAGGPDPTRLSEVPAGIRERVDLTLDGGPLPGVASTVIDLRRWEREGSWQVLRTGALSEAEVERRLGA